LWGRHQPPVLHFAVPILRSKLRRQAEVKNELRLRVEAPLGLVEEGDAPGWSEVRLLLKSEAGLFFQLLAYREWKEFSLAIVLFRSSIHQLRINIQRQGSSCVSKFLFLSCLVDYNFNRSRYP
jgi:hypothetical protein